MSERIRVAVLDDYQHVARQMADWSPVDALADVVVFHDHVEDEAELARRLAPFDAICVMRERTAMTASLIGALPRLNLIASTVRTHPSIWKPRPRMALRSYIRTTHRRRRSSSPGRRSSAWRATSPTRRRRSVPGDGSKALA
jgi:hypothetical protein